MPNSISPVLIFVMVVVYSICSIVLFLYSIVNLTMSLIYIFKGQKIWRKPQEIPALPGEWPRVTVQLPCFNEKHTIERLLRAVTEMDYPVDKLEIQILDDSTDITADILGELTKVYQQLGFDVKFIHRSARMGYKAGALDNGLKQASSDFLAIFDADFIPPQDWLKKVVPVLASDSNLAFVQTRWTYTNDDYNMLTRVQSMALDAGFVIDQTARYTGNLFMGFNGSAGMWRKAAIEDAGGWSWDTVTEDLDLSFRAEMKGWKFVYLPQITVPSEVPAQIDAIKLQQNRWAKGTIQTCRKLFGKVWHSKFPLYKRLLGLGQMSMYMPFALMIISLLLVLPLGLWAPWAFTYFGFTVVTSFAPFLFFSLAKTESRPRLIDRWVRIPFLLLFGVGLSLTCGLAAIAGLFQNGGVFERTPKLNLRNGQKIQTRSNYWLPVSPMVWGEIAMGIYNLVTLWALYRTPVGISLCPYLIFCALGFFMMAYWSIQDRWKQSNLKTSKSKSERQPATQ